jgi:catechol 2,3-dioxygenase-like lactoylglutathione lyase family enzyme
MAPDGGSAPTLTTVSLIDHVALAAHDAVAAARWFERTLGLRRAHGLRGRAGATPGMSPAGAEGAHSVW